MELPDNLRELLEKRKEIDPELFEKYGDPTNPDDPRFWSPSKRKEEGLSIEDRLTYLELDVEAMTLAMGPVMTWVLRKQAEEMAAQLRDDPIGFLKNMVAKGASPEEALELIGSLTNAMEQQQPNYERSYGPDGTDGNAYAGSTQGIAPDTMVDSINGPIRADQIPGYRNEPGWRPSPDWVDANCTCESHKAQRAAASNGEMDGGFGQYL